ncbi:MAG: hypothetical protein J5806_08530 [Lentisphaeria bacterium]|nr:hypothetical protein [Lentisphaeria bacterium]
MNKLFASLIVTAAFLLPQMLSAAGNETIAASEHAACKKSIKSFFVTCLKNDNAETFPDTAFVPEVRKSKAFVAEEWKDADSDWSGFTISKIQFTKNTAVVDGNFYENNDPDFAELDVYRFVLCRRKGKWLILQIQKFPDGEGKGLKYDFAAGKFIK